MPKRRPGTSKSKGDRGTRRTIVLLVLASITIITLDYRGRLAGSIGSLRSVAHQAFSPLQTVTDDALRPIGAFVGGIVHYQTVVSENNQLRRELAAARSGQITAQELKDQLKAITALEHLPWIGSQPTVAAEVVTGGTSDFSSTVNLDRGANSGVEVGMPVVTGAGLVGQVVQVWGSGSTVRLVDDPQFVVGVKFGNPATTALASGKGPGTSLEIDGVPPGTGISKGTILYTSGLQNELFPSEIPVATVVSAQTTATSNQESIAAKPLVNLSRLQYVDVVQWTP